MTRTQIHAEINAILADQANLTHAELRTKVQAVIDQANQES